MQIRDVVEFTSSIDQAWYTEMADYL